MSKRFLDELYDLDILSQMPAYKTQRTQSTSRSQAANTIKKFFKGTKKSAASRERFGTKSTNGPEVKFIDYANSTTTVSSGAVVCINASVQGTDDVGQRIGRKISMTSAEVDLVWTQTPTNLLTSGGLAVNAGANRLHVALVYDHQTNGNVPGYSDIYTPAGVGAPLGHRQQSTLDRFTVLWSENLLISTAGDNAAQISKKYMSFKHDTVYFSTNVGTVADVNSGGLYLVFADMNTNGNLPAQLVFCTRVRFYDM